MNRRRMIMSLACALIMAFAMTASAYGETEHTKYDSVKTGQVNCSTSLNVRAAAAAGADKLGSLASGKKMTLLGEAVNDEGEMWYKITYSGKTGYIKSDYVDIVKTLSYRIYTPYKYGKTTAKLNVRSNAGTGYSRLGTLSSGSKKILYGYKYKSGKKWYRVKYGSKYGYVSSKYVKLISKATYEKKTSTSSTVSKGKAVANYALKYVGKTPYKYGGSSLKTGCDCSGFVSAVYRHFGYSLPHTSGGIAKKGRAVSRKNARAGDVICTSGHVAIYIGNGKIVHARNPGERVRIDSIGYGSVAKYSGKRITTIRRIVK